MKTSSRILSIATAALTLGAGGFAYGHGGQGANNHMGGGMGMHQGMGSGAGHGMHHAGPSADAATQLAATKAELKITAAQEAAWQAFETVVLQQASARQALRAGLQARMQDPAAAASVDHQAQREAMQKLRQNEQAARDQARQALYAVLSPEQKALADQRLGAGQGKHKGGHRHTS